LGVGLRFEFVPEAPEALALFLVVLDDAVVHQGHAVAHVRVRVGLGHAAVGRPARVADAERGAEALGAGGALHLGHPAGAAHAADVAAVDDSDAGGVVAAVLESLEPLDEDWNHIAIRDRANDAAHGGGRLYGKPHSVTAKAPTAVRHGC